MRKNVRRMAACFCMAACIWCWNLLTHREKLNEELIRLHVVANSDSVFDQNVKLQVRDAVMASLQDAMADISDMEQAREYISVHLPQIQKTANEVLEQLGVSERAVVSLKREKFDTRVYDTFSLPAGVYESLRVTIGDGEGKNWWCVVFPTFCMSAAGEEFSEVAVSAGFPEALTAALEGEEDYEIRFFLLDLLGRLEAHFYKG